MGDRSDRTPTGGLRIETGTLLIEAFRRIPELVHGACDGLDAAGLAYRPEPGANSIAWLVWHLSRVQDDHVAEIGATDQVWADRIWAKRTGIDRDGMATGYGDTPDDVTAIVPESSEALVAYHDAVAERTMEYLERVDPSELDRTIDRPYSPPVLVGVRLVSVISDNLQHAGQARYLRGTIERLS